MPSSSAVSPSTTFASSLTFSSLVPSSLQTTKTMAPLVRVLPPSYSPASTSRPLPPPNAHASSSNSSRSSSRARAPKLHRGTSAMNDEDYLHWSPSPPFVEGTKLPSSVTISYPPQDLLVLLAPPKVDPLGEEDWSGVDEGRDVSRLTLGPAFPSLFSPPRTPLTSSHPPPSVLSHSNDHHRLSEKEGLRRSRSHPRRLATALFFA